jgi:hypothetical protein
VNADGLRRVYFPVEGGERAAEPYRKETDDEFVARIYGISVDEARRRREEDRILF